MASQDEQTADTTEAAGSVSTESGTEQAEQSAPPARTPRKRATKKASAPKAASEPVSTAVEEDPTAGTEPAPAATAKRAPRKAAKKAAVAPDDTPAAKKPARKAAAKTTRKTAKPAGTPPADPGQEPAPEASVAESTPAPASESTPAPASTPEAAPAPAAETGPTFGLLFQAPDLEAAPPRRRATRPVAAPAPAAEPPSAELPPAAQADDPATAGGDGEPSDDTEPAAGRRSSRRDRSARPDRAATPATAEVDDDETTGATPDEAQDGPDDGEDASGRRRRRRGGKGRRGRGGDSERTTDHGDGEASTGETGPEDGQDTSDEPVEGSSRRRRRRRRSGTGESDDPPGTTTRVREPRARDEVSGVRGSTRLEAKKQRRREGREAGRRRTIITEAEFLARRESVERVMVVREKDSRTQIAVLEDGVLVEHYVSRETNASMAGNIYLGRVQNVLPSMEAAFVDIGKGRNAVLYAGEVNWDAAGMESNAPKRIENALRSGDSVLVQVTKDPIGHKGARLTSQISLPGRYLVYVPESSMTGISRKLPDTERSRLKAILKEVVPQSAGVIVRTAAEGASEEELRADVERLTKEWDRIKGLSDKASGKKTSGGGAPTLLHGEPDLTVRVIRDIFNEDFASLVVEGEQAWQDVHGYVSDVASDLTDRVTRWTGESDVFTHHRVSEQLAKAMDRKVWLPSGGSLVIDRTEAMTVVDVNTGKFVGSGGNLEETVTKNNIEAAEEIVRQLRLRDIGGIIVIDFIDMVLESNRDLVVRRLLECLGRDRTKHQVAEVTSLGLVQMTRKRVGSGLIEVFSEPCEHCNGRGLIIHTDPVDKPADSGSSGGGSRGSSSRRGRGDSAPKQEQPAAPAPSGPTAAQIAAAAHAAAMKLSGGPSDAPEGQDAPVEVVRETDGDQEQPVPVTRPLERESGTVGAAATVPPDPASPGAGEERGALAPAPEQEPVDRGPAVSTPMHTTAYEPPPATVVTAPRRRRGRVVAPAGPPRPTGEESVAAADTAH